MLSWSPELKRALQNAKCPPIHHGEYIRKAKLSTIVDASRLETRLFVNNEFVNSVSGRVFTSLTLGNVQESTCEDVDKAVSCCTVTKPCICRGDLIVFLLRYLPFMFQNT
jgi:hypothetical protein